MKMMDMDLGIQGDVASRMQTVFQKMSAAEQQVASTANYDNAKAKLDELPGLLERAIDRDEREADSFWTKVKRFFKYGGFPASAHQRFEQDAAAIKMAAVQNLSTLQAIMASFFGIHAQVPDTLEADAESWQLEHHKVLEMGGMMANLRFVEGWTGESAQQYATAVEVQVNAAQELAGVIESVATSCNAASTLNRAYFYLAEKEITKGIEVIRSASGGKYYRRTANCAETFKSIIDALNRVLQHEYTTHSVTELSSQLTRTASLPNLLRGASWPTGTADAGVAPAPTNQGVTNTGQADSLSGGQVAGGGNGVRL